MAGNELNISIRADVSQLTAGLDQAKTAVAQAGAAMQSAMTPSAALAASMKDQAFSAEDCAGALKNLGYSAAEVSAAVASAGYAATETAAKTEVATSAVTGLDRAMANATARIAAADAGLGGLGMALGRVASQSSTLGPLLSAAFPIIGITAVVMIVEQLGKKLYDAYQNAILLKDAIAGLDKAAMKQAETAASLNYEYDITNARLLEQRGNFAAAADMFKKASAEKPLKLFEIDDKNFKQFSADFVSFMQAVHSVSDAPTVIARIQAEAESTAAQLVTAKERLKDIQFAMEATGQAPIGQFARAEAEVNDLTKKLAMLKTAMGEVQSQTGISDAALAEILKGIADKETKAAEARQKRDEQAVAGNRRLEEEARKLADEEKRFDTEVADWGKKEQQRERDADTKASGERIAAENKFREERMSDTEEAAVAAIALKEDQVREEYRLGQISAQQAKEQLDQLAADKLAVEKKYLDDRLEIYYAMQRHGETLNAQEYEDFSRLLHDKMKAELEYQKELQQVRDATATRQEKLEEQLARAIDRTFSEMLRSTLKGTKSIGQAFEQMLGNMLLGLVDALAKMLAKHIAHWALVNIIEKVGVLNSIATQLTGTTAKQAVIATGNIAAVTSSAGAAGAAGFASVMEALPFPANVAVAPGVMAAAISTTMSNVALASAEGGWDMVPFGGAWTRLHPREMVLPASLADGIRNIASGGGGSTSSTAPFGQPPQINVHYSPRVHAIDTRGMKEALSKHGSDIAALLQREMREFRF